MIIEHLFFLLLLLLQVLLVWCSREVGSIFPFNEFFIFPFTRLQLYVVLVFYSYGIFVQVRDIKLLTWVSNDWINIM